MTPARLALALFAFFPLTAPAVARAQSIPMPNSPTSSQPQNVRSIAITATDRVIRPAEVVVARTPEHAR